MDEKVSLFDEIRSLVSQVPKGKVTTYGAIAKILGMRDVRKVGWAMYNNKDPNVPCHRVVKAGGLICVNHPEWMEEQRNKLLEENVTFVDDTHVDLANHLWEIKPKS